MRRTAPSMANLNQTDCCTCSPAREILKLHQTRFSSFVALCDYGDWASPLSPCIFFFLCPYEWDLCYRVVYGNSPEVRDGVSSARKRPVYEAGRQSLENSEPEKYYFYIGCRDQFYVLDFIKVRV